MNVVLYGATGRAGSRILNELISRGHKVTAVTRDRQKLESSSLVSIKTDDLSDVSHTAETIQGADAVISAYAPPPDNTDQLVDVTRHLIDAVTLSGVPRLLMVGGAASLEVAPGVLLIDSGQLPQEWLPISKSHLKALRLLQSCSLNWTYFSPAAYFDPGVRTGTFRLGTNSLIVDDKGDSKISMEDYAIAMVDELENNKYPRQRFTIGY